MKRVYHEANSACVSASLSVLGPGNLTLQCHFLFLKKPLKSQKAQALQNLHLYLSVPQNHTRGIKDG